MIGIDREIAPGLDLRVAEANPLWQGILKGMGIWKEVNGQVLLTRSNAMEIPELNLTVLLSSPTDLAISESVMYHLRGNLEDITSYRGMLTHATHWEAYQENRRPM